MEDDPIIAEHDVYIATQLAPYLHILQLPGNIAELEDGLSSVSGRFKRSHKILELDLPLDTTRSTYSVERGEELLSCSSSGRIKMQGSAEDSISSQAGKLTTIKLSGSPVPLSKDIKYFLAVYSGDGSIHMTPVENMIQMRPSLTYLDESDAKTKNVAKRLEHETTNASQDKLKAVQVQFKKRETEEQIAARLSSYAYLQRQVEEEPWIGITHFLPETSESTTVSERLLSNSTVPIEFQ